MIYTVTCNPSLDYIMELDSFFEGKTNRSRKETICVGGKGINVSIVLHEIGQETTAFLFAAGFVGDEIVRRMNASGIPSRIISLPDGCSRINVKCKGMDGTEINAAGPFVPKEKQNELLQILDEIQKEDYLVLSGSVAPGMDKDFYARICQRMEERGVPVVVDAGGETLRRALPFHPFLIKPNRQELEEYYGVSLGNREEIKEYAKRLIAEGAKNVMVSLGAGGAVLLTRKGDVYDRKTIPGDVIQTVGSGDSMIAGFLYSLAEKKDPEEAFAYAMAAGMAAAFSEGLPKKRSIEEMYSKIYLPEA